MQANNFYTKTSLKKLICLFSKDVISDVIIKMDAFSHIDEAEIPGLMKKNKNIISNRMVSDVQNSQYERLFGFLEILYLQKKQTRKWTVYEMMDQQGDQYLLINKVNLKDSLNKHVRNSRFETDVIVNMMGNSLWCRLAISDPLQTNNTPSRIFFVYFPGSNFLIMSQIPKKHNEFVLNCLCGVFSCDTLETMALYGHDVESLAKLAKDKSKSNAAINQRTLSELLHPKNHGDVVTPTKNCRIIDDDLEMKENRYEYCKQKFGKDSLPELKHLTYETETKLHPEDNNVNGWDVSNILKCQVSFHGSNVLQGIKSMVMDGIAEAPLPPYIANVTRLGQNILKIKEKSSKSG